MQADRLEFLLERYQSGAASSDEMAELEASLRADPATRRVFAERFLLEVQLHRAFSGVVPMSLPLPTPARWSRRVVMLAAAAAVVLMVVGAIVLSPFGRKQLSGLEVVKGEVSVDGVAVTHIPTGQWFEVGNAPAVIRLADGTRAELGPASRALIQGQPGEVRQVVELAQGSGSFHVTHGSGQFRVQTPVATVTALGTEFSVKLRPLGKNRAAAKGKPAVAVAVTAGTVQVDAGGKSYVLAAGKKRVYGDDGEQNDNDDGQQNNRDDGEQNNQGPKPEKDR